KRVADPPFALDLRRADLFEVARDHRLGDTEAAVRQPRCDVVRVARPALPQQVNDRPLTPPSLLNHGRQDTPVSELPPCGAGKQSWRDEQWRARQDSNLRPQA